MRKKDDTAEDVGRSQSTRKRFGKPPYPPRGKLKLESCKGGNERKTRWRCYWWGTWRVKRKTYWIRRYKETVKGEENWKWPRIEVERETRNEREPRGKVAGRKLGSENVKEYIYKVRKNDAQNWKYVERKEWRTGTAARKAGRSSGGNEVTKNWKLLSEWWNEEWN